MIDYETAKNKIRLNCKYLVSKGKCEIAINPIAITCEQVNCEIANELELDNVGFLKFKSICKDHNDNECGAAIRKRDTNPKICIDIVKANCCDIVNKLCEHIPRS